MLQSYHHITERSKYIREFERQKVFLEFFSEYTFEYKIVSLTVVSQFMCSESCIVCLHALEFTRLWLQVLWQVLMLNFYVQFVIIRCCSNYT